MRPPPVVPIRRRLGSSQGRGEILKSVPGWPVAEENEGGGDACSRSRLRPCSTKPATQVSSPGQHGTARLTCCSRVPRAVLYSPSSSLTPYQTVSGLVYCPRGRPKSSRRGQISLFFFFCFWEHIWIATTTG